MKKNNTKTMSEIVDCIVRKYHPEKVILFGSYASGAHTKNSDIDLFIILNADKSSWDISVEISSNLTHSTPLDIVVKTPKEIEKRLRMGDFFIKNVVESGRVLYERTC